MVMFPIKSTLSARGLVQGVTLALSIALFAVPQASAADKPSPKNTAISDWIDQLSKSVRDQTAVFISRLAVTTELNEQTGADPILRPMDAKTFSALSYISMAQPQNLGWDLKINQKTMIGKSPAQSLFAVGSLDTVVDAPKSGPWRFLRLSSEGHVTEMVSVSAPTSAETADEFDDWLFSTLGYDGVVLDRREHLVLVGSRAGILRQAGIQALSLKNSADQLIVDRKDRSGSGLLSLVAHQGSFAIFEIVFLADDADLKRGTKLIVEKSTAVPAKKR